jgi:hypothetical protein
MPRMASRPPPLAAIPLVFLACDPASRGEPKAAPPPQEPIVLAACDEPMVDDDAQCEAPELQEAASTTEVDPDLAGTPNLRNVSALVHAGVDLIVGAGSYGDFSGEGAYIVAIATDGSVAWSASIPTTAAEITNVVAVGDADGVWLLAAQDDDTTIAQRYDVAGMPLGNATTADFSVVSAIAQPMGAVAMTGTSGGDAAYVGLAADGTENYNGATNDAEGLYVIANGTVELFDGGASSWEVDPRGTPPEGFPVEIGAKAGVVFASGDVVAIGQGFGPLGDNSLIVRIDPEGESVWSLSRPRALVDVVVEGALDTTIVAGRSFHCSPGTYLAVFDPAALQLQEVRVDAPPTPWIAVAEGSVASLAPEGNVLTLRAYDVEVEAP